MIKVFSVAEMVAAEKASDAAGNSYDEMMEKAGWAVAEALKKRFPVVGSKITILVGPGNNGGDGLVAGRYLAEAGADVTFYLFRDREPASDINFAKVQELNLPTIVAGYDQRYRVLRNRLRITDVLIDALLGTGVSRPIGGELAKLMQQMKAALEEQAGFVRKKSQSRLVSIAEVSDELNAQEPFPFLSDQDLEVASSQTTSRPYPFIVAVDCPSGLNCDTGQIDELAPIADLSVTFAGPKRGHFIFPGAAACGEIVVADIDISQDLPEVADVKLELATAGMASALLPDRRKDGHKGSFGWVLIAAGSARYWGAAALAGRAAYRAGAGLVALAVPAAIRPSLAVQLPEATYPLIADENELGAQSAQQLLEDMATYQALLVGPGLHRASAFIKRLLSPDGHNLPPTVVDADGLNILAELPDWPALLPDQSVLTPHPGEMARLMGISLAEMKSLDRVTLAQEKAAEWRCVLLLKGAYTVIAAPDGRSALLPFANPVLATAGSGDVLAGVIVSLLGQGLAAFEAAVLGGYLHGAAAELPGVTGGLLAAEIADWVPDVIEVLRGQRRPF